VDGDQWGPSATFRKTEQISYGVVTGAGQFLAVYSLASGTNWQERTATCLIIWEYVVCRVNTIENCSDIEGKLTSLAISIIPATVFVLII